MVDGDIRGGAQLLHRVAAYPTEIVPQLDGPGFSEWQKSVVCYRGRTQQPNSNSGSHVSAAVQLAHFGHYWGDRPTIGQILKMIETGTYEFNASPLKKGPH